MTALEAAAEEPVPRTGDPLPVGAPALPAVKPLLRGWLHLISFEASLVLGTLALASAHGAVGITTIAVFAASVSALFGPARCITAATGPPRGTGACSDWITP